MALQNGDFVEIEYTAKKASDGVVFDTTDEAKARSAGIYAENTRYGPLLVVVGKGHVVSGLDEALVGMEVGQERSVEVLPEKGFGKKDPKLLRVMSLNEFRKQRIEPYPGMPVTLDGISAVVKSVSGGRVMVDMNHPLAGEKLIYDVKVVRKLETEEEKIRGLLSSEKLDGEIKFGDVVTISIKNAKNDVSYFIAKSNFLRRLFELMDMKKVRVVEDFVKDEKKPTESENEEKQAETEKEKTD
ncbi:MAG: peptidylprolyl isomerase [Candidatus Micrarchaeia archaeon]